MRLWSLHPKYLDAQGLVALWREGLLALKVLQGKARGYKNHPQLERFRSLKKETLAPESGALCVHQGLYESHASSSFQNGSRQCCNLGKGMRV